MKLHLYIRVQPDATDEDISAVVRSKVANISGSITRDSWPFQNVAKVTTEVTDTSSLAFWFGMRKNWKDSTVGDLIAYKVVESC